MRPTDGIYEYKETPDDLRGFALLTEGFYCSLSARILRSITIVSSYSQSWLARLK
jgi:hypothetical protein